MQPAHGVADCFAGAEGRIETVDVAGPIVGLDHELGDRVAGILPAAVFDIDFVVGIPPQIGGIPAGAVLPEEYPEHSLGVDQIQPANRGQDIVPVSKGLFGHNLGAVPGAGDVFEGKVQLTVAIHPNIIG